MALDNFRTIELIWDRANKSIIKTIKTASSDTTGRYLSVKILDGGQEVTLNNAKLQLYWEHPNFNTNGTDDFNTVNNGGLFKITFSDEMLTNIGELNAHLVLTLTDGKITSGGFPIEVFKGADDGVVVPTNGAGLVKQIDRKIDKGNVTLNDLTQDVKLAMTGGSVAVVGERSVGTANLIDNSVTSEKLRDNSVNHKKVDFIISGKESKNLFDKSKAVIGYRLDSTDGVTPVPSNGYAYVQNITVKKNSDLFRNKSGGLFVFDDSNNLVMSRGNGATDIAFNSGEGTRVSFNIETTDIDSVMLEYGSVGTPYEEYFESASTLNPNIKVESDSLELNQLQDIYTAGSGISIENGIISNTQGNSEMSNKYYKVVAENSFRIFQKIGGKDFAGYLYGAYGGENYMRMLDIAIFEIKEGAETSEPYDLISGAMASTSTDNHYTTTAGTKVGLTFRGTSLTFNYLSRIDGGLWKVMIDGVEYPSISTWNATQSPKSAKIAEGLTNSLHSVILEFVGSDPNNPPKHFNTGADTTARGWLRSPDTFVFTETGGGSYHFEEKGLITSKTSNKDFAITVEPRDITGEPQFFPLHSGNNTTNVISKRLTIDGKDIDLTVPTGVLPFENGAFLEYLESKMTYETGTRAEGSILWKFEENRINQEFELTFLKPTTLRNGYIFMLPVPYDILDKVKTNKREVTYRDSEDMGTDTYFDNVTTDIFRMLYSGDYKDFYLEAGVTNYSHPLERLWLQRRDDSLYKLYPQFFLQTEINSGESIFFDGYFSVGKIKGINN